MATKTTVSIQHQTYKADFNGFRCTVYGFTCKKDEVLMLDSNQNSSPRFWFFWRFIHNTVMGNQHNHKSGETSREFERLEKMFPGHCIKQQVRLYNYNGKPKECHEYQLVSWIALENLLHTVNSGVVKDFEKWALKTLVRKMKELRQLAKDELMMEAEIEEVDETEEDVECVEEYEDECEEEQDCDSSEEDLSTSTELVPVSRMEIGDELQNTCNARELWEFMESKQKYADWIKLKLSKTRAVEGKHYVTFRNVTKRENGGATVKTEYHITLDIAKHFAMLENTDRGFQVREYFIEVERDWVPEKISHRFSEDYEKVKAEYLEEQESTCTDLVVVQDGVVLADSLTVAKNFGKDHADVIKKIKLILSESGERAAGNFTGCYYHDQNGRKRPFYSMTRDGFSFLVMGFTGSKANAWKWKYIDAFNAMEKELLKTIQGDNSHDNMDMFNTMTAFMSKTMEVMDKIVSTIDRLNKSDYSIVQPPTHLTVLGYAKLLEIDIDLKSAQAIGRRATRLCERENLEVRSVKDERYETVNSYPVEVLKEIFAAIYHGTTTPKLSKIKPN